MSREQIKAYVKKWSFGDAKGDRDSILSEVKRTRDRIWGARHCQANEGGEDEAREAFKSCVKLLRIVHDALKSLKGHNQLSAPVLEHIGEGAIPQAIKTLAEPYSRGSQYRRSYTLHKAEYSTLSTTVLQWAKEDTLPQEVIDDCLTSLERSGNQLQRVKSEAGVSGVGGISMGSPSLPGSALPTVERSPVYHATAGAAEEHPRGQNGNADEEVWDERAELAELEAELRRVFGAPETDPVLLIPHADDEREGTGWGKHGWACDPNKEQPFGAWAGYRSPGRPPSVSPEPAERTVSPAARMPRQQAASPSREVRAKMSSASSASAERGRRDRQERASSPQRSSGSKLEKTESREHTIDDAAGKRTSSATKTSGAGAPEADGRRSRRSTSRHASSPGRSMSAARSRSPLERRSGRGKRSRSRSRGSSRGRARRQRRHSKSRSHSQGRRRSSGRSDSRGRNWRGRDESVQGGRYGTDGPPASKRKNFGGYAAFASDESPGHRRGGRSRSRSRSRSRNRHRSRRRGSSSASSRERERRGSRGSAARESRAADGHHSSGGFESWRRRPDKRGGGGSTERWTQPSSDTEREGARRRRAGRAEKPSPAKASGAGVTRPQKAREEARAAAAGAGRAAVAANAAARGGSAAAQKAAGVKAVLAGEEEGEIVLTDDGALVDSALVQLVGAAGKTLELVAQGRAAANHAEVVHGRTSETSLAVAAPAREVQPAKAEVASDRKAANEESDPERTPRVTGFLSEKAQVDSNPPADHEDSDPDRTPRFVPSGVGEQALSAAASCDAALQRRVGSPVERREAAVVPCSEAAGPVSTASNSVQEDAAATQGAVATSKAVEDKPIKDEEAVLAPKPAEPEVSKEDIQAAGSLLPASSGGAPTEDAAALPANAAAAGTAVEDPGGRKDAENSAPETGPSAMERKEDREAPSAGALPAAAATSSSPSAASAKELKETPASSTTVAPQKAPAVSESDATAPAAKFEAMLQAAKAEIAERSGGASPVLAAAEKPEESDATAPAARVEAMLSAAMAKISERCGEASPVLAAAGKATALPAASDSTAKASPVLAAAGKGEALAAARASTAKHLEASPVLAAADKAEALPVAEASAAASASTAKRLEASLVSAAAEKAKALPAASDSTAKASPVLAAADKAEASAAASPSTAKRLEASPVAAAAEEAKALPAARASTAKRFETNPVLAAADKAKTLPAARVSTAKRSAASALLAADDKAKVLPVGSASAAKRSKASPVPAAADTAKASPIEPARQASAKASQGPAPPPATARGTKRRLTQEESAPKPDPQAGMPTKAQKHSPAKRARGRGAAVMTDAMRANDSDQEQEETNFLRNDQRLSVMQRLGAGRGGNASGRSLQPAEAGNNASGGGGGNGRTGSASKPVSLRMVTRGNSGIKRANSEAAGDVPEGIERRVSRGSPGAAASSEVEPQPQHGLAKTDRTTGNRNRRRKWS